MARFKDKIFLKSVFDLPGTDAIVTQMSEGIPLPFTQTNPAHEHMEIWKKVAGSEWSTESTWPYPFSSSENLEGFMNKIARDHPQAFVYVALTEQETGKFFEHLRKLISRVRTCLSEEQLVSIINCALDKTPYEVVLTPPCLPANNRIRLALKIRHSE